MPKALALLLPSLVFALIVAFAGSARAQEATGVEIIEYGLFEIGPSLGEFAPPNLGYRHEVIDSFRHTETTDTVLGRIGVAFGVRYRITGTGIVPLRIVLRFPEQGLYSPEFREALHVDETEQYTLIGEEGYSGISFDEQWEIEPGFWTIEFWSGERKLGEKIFEVITPPIS
jgi:hypothetical protein